MATQVDVNDRIHALQLQITELHSLMMIMRAEMNSMKWWLFGSIMLGIATATAIILAAIAIWG